MIFYISRINMSETYLHITVILMTTWLNVLMYKCNQYTKGKTKIDKFSITQNILRRSITTII